jgi:glycosyltransferase involved in cell wall biosynthesis
MSTPLVSITSAFYNEESYLLDMVKSVFAQTFTDWELILVDDGSTDKSLQLARSVDDPRVRVFSNGRNLGRSATLNKITMLSRGKYIARFDADDMCSPTRIEKEFNFLENHPEIDVVSTGVISLGRGDVPLGHNFALPTHEQICEDPMRYIAISHPAAMGRKNWFEKNPYDESISISIDANLWFRTYQHSNFANIPEPLFYYRLKKAFTLKKQFNSRKTSAKYLFDYYNKTGHPVKALTCLVSRYGKFAITLFAFAFGIQKVIMAKRYTPIAEEKFQLYLKEISQIKNTKLPIHSEQK